MLSYERATGWTLASGALCHVARARSREEVEEALAEAHGRGLSVIPRGAGYSYGDEILNEGGVVLDLSRMDRVLAWDPEAGRLTVEPGVSFEKALEVCLKDGWVIPAVPGVRYPTLGGSLANNVHGKNSWRDGNLGDWVVAFTLLAGDGRAYRCSRQENPELFRAAIGGLGLLGVFLEIVLQCKRVPSPYLEVRKWTAPNLEAMLEDFEVLRESADYHIGWVDCFARQGALGRGTVHAARFAEAPGRDAVRDLAYTSPYLFGFFPRQWVWPLVKPFFGNALVRAVNAAKFGVDRLTGNGRPHLQNFFEFTFLLDAIPEWRQLFAPHGYFELEAVVPFEACPGTFRELIALTQGHGTPSYLTAIKSHRADDFLLSHALDGCSIALDIPVQPGREGELDRLFHRMNELVLEAGGRTYLAKDDKLTADQFRRMYPRWEEFDALKRRYDPGLVFQSGMYRRLFVGEPGSRAGDVEGAPARPAGEEARKR